MFFRKVPLRIQFKHHHHNICNLNQQITNIKAIIESRNGWKIEIGPNKNKSLVHCSRLYLDDECVLIYSCSIEVIEDYSTAQNQRSEKDKLLDWPFSVWFYLFLVQLFGNVGDILGDYCLDSFMDNILHSRNHDILFIYSIIDIQQT